MSSRNDVRKTSATHASLYPLVGPGAPSVVDGTDLQLSDLIGLIYDAVIDPTLWNNAIEQAAGFVGGVGGGLFCRDVGADHVSIPHRVGFVTPLKIELVRPIYPAVDRHFLGEIGQPVATTDLLAFEQIARSELYRQWAQPQGFVDFVSAVIDRTAFSVAFFGVFRHERDGLVDNAARRHMRLIAPHVARAVLISRMFEFKAAEAATLIDTLDGLSAGMFLVDAGARLIHSNAAGAAILAARDILGCAGGRLVAPDKQVDQTLREIFAAADQGDAAVGTKGIAVALTGTDGARYVAHVLPLTSGARRRAGVVYTATAALFVHKAALDASSAVDVVGRAFKLTPTELRVLLAVVEVGTIPEIAASFGVADTTIRTHVNHLFEKTGASRQADLVRLVAGYAKPMG
jgi:DNA-binding CsgD family transcriptional regulator